MRDVISSPRSPMRLAALSFILVAAVQPARAADIPCGAVEPDVIGIDGLLEDWNEVPGIDIGGGAGDLSFTVKCNYDNRSLYLAVDVRDDYLVRTRAAKPGEDHVEIDFADRDKIEKLVVFPGDSQARVPHKLFWQGGRKSKDVQVADSLQ